MDEEAEERWVGECTGPEERMVEEGPVMGRAGVVECPVGGPGMGGVVAERWPKEEVRLER